jgi:hypothetical protein
MEELNQAALEAAAIVGRAGGIIQIAADRVKLRPEEEGAEPVFYTEGFSFRWFSYAPVREADGEQTVEEPPSSNGAVEDESLRDEIEAEVEAREAAAEEPQSASS